MNPYLTDPKFAGAYHAIELCENLKLWDMYAAEADRVGIWQLAQKLKRDANNAMEKCDPARMQIIEEALAEWDEPGFSLYLKAKITGYYAL